MAVSRSVEVELKYTAPADAVLPELDSVPGIASAEPEPVAHLEAVYLDTADRALLRARIALRRRTGGHDAGWHVKLPAASGRTELHAPIDPAEPDRVPDDLARSLASRTHGSPLGPLARITTERRGLLVIGSDGGRVEVVDDEVRAVDVEAGTTRAWREWEAERLGDEAAGDALLRTVDVALRAAGAVPSDSPAKLAQALGLRAARRPKPATDSGGVLRLMVAPLAEELHRAMTGLVLDGDPDGSAVHGMRRTLRRLRSVLALRAVSGPSGAALRDQLRGFAGPLGGARDPLVAADVAEDLLARLPAGSPGAGAARALLVDEPRAHAADRTTAAVDALLAPGAAATWAALDAFVAAGPDGPAAGSPPKRLRRLARRAVRRADRRGAAAGADLDALHAARKGAKRARMVVDELVAAGIVGRRSSLARASGRAERMQDALGEHRDLALLLASLPVASERLTAAGGNAFALGLAAAAGRRRLRRLLADARRRMRALHR